MRLGRTVRRCLLLLLAGAFAGIGTPSEAEAQFGRLKEKIKAKAQAEAEEKMDLAVEKGFEELERRVVCVITDQACIDAAAEDGQGVVLTDEDGEQVGELPPPDSPGALRPGEGAWSNYDFVRGERILFADDFRAERVGNFPQRLEFHEGTLEVTEWNGGRYLRATSRGGFIVNLPEALPERFTIEFLAHQPHNSVTLYVYTLAPDETPGRTPKGDERAVVQVGRESGLHDRAETTTPAVNEDLAAVRIAADGDYMKVYVNEQRVANVPNARVLRSDRLYVRFASASNILPTLFADLVVAAGGLEMYDALMANGRVVTQGILFDTGSDRLRPESTPVLRQIAEMLAAYPDLALTIEGHTDDVGDDAANQVLSERRAEAVMGFLVEAHGVDAGRLDAVGLGESMPAVPGTSPEARQQNRRVELVKR